MQQLVDGIWLHLQLFGDLVGAFALDYRVYQGGALALG